MAGAAIWTGITAAASVVDAANVFLFTHPTSTSAALEIATAIKGATMSIGLAAMAFLAAGLIAIILNNDYMKPTSTGICSAATAYGWWFLAAIAMVLWVKTKNNPSIPMMYSILFGLFAFGYALKKGACVFATARRHMVRNADDLLQRKAAPAILYLRSFSADVKPAPDNYALQSREWGPLASRLLNWAFWGERRDWTFEEILCKGLWAIAPVVAIGQPDERLPKLGAARKYVADKDWRDEVTRLLAQARFACLAIGSSRGLIWEFSQIVSLKQPQRFVLVIPPDADGRNEIWNSFVREVVSEHISVNLPAVLPDRTLAVTFTDAGAPVIFVGRPTIPNYKEIGQYVAGYGS